MAARRLSAPARGDAGLLSAWLQRPALSYVVSLAVGILIWHLVARQLPGVVFATPWSTLQRIVGDTVNLTLPLALAHSLGHMIVGYLLALAVAIPLGFLMGATKRRS